LINCPKRSFSLALNSTFVVFIPLLYTLVALMITFLVHSTQNDKARWVAETLTDFIAQTI